MSGYLFDKGLTKIQLQNIYKTYQYFETIQLNAIAPETVLRVRKQQSLVQIQTKTLHCNINSLTGYTMENLERPTHFS